MTATQAGRLPAEIRLLHIRVFQQRRGPVRLDHPPGLEEGQGGEVQG